MHYSKYIQKALLSHTWIWVLRWYKEASGHSEQQVKILIDEVSFCSFQTGRTEGFSRNEWDLL